MTVTYIPCSVGWYSVLSEVKGTTGCWLSVCLYKECGISERCECSAVVSDGGA